MTTPPRPHPQPVAAIRRPGLVPRRLLLFGSGVLTGEGLTSHDAGLPGAIADAVARRSRRGADITVIVEPEPLSKRALEGLRGLRLHRFDAVIVLLPAALPSPSGARRRGREHQKLALSSPPNATPAPPPSSTTPPRR